MSLDFYVVDLESIPILGLEACTKFNLVKKIASLTTGLSSREPILRDYKDVLAGPRMYVAKVSYCEIRQDASPVVHPPRKELLACKENGSKLY